MLVGTDVVRIHGLLVRLLDCFARLKVLVSDSCEAFDESSWSSGHRSCLGPFGSAAARLFWRTGVIIQRSPKCRSGLRCDRLHILTRPVS